MWKLFGSMYVFDLLLVFQYGRDDLFKYGEYRKWGLLIQSLKKCECGMLLRFIPLCVFIGFLTIVLVSFLGDYGVYMMTGNLSIFMMRTIVFVSLIISGIYFYLGMQQGLITENTPFYAIYSKLYIILMCLVLRSCLGDCILEFVRQGYGIIDNALRLSTTDMMFVAERIAEKI